MKKGFTLIELLVTIGIVAAVSSIIFLILNPVEYVRRARDSQRLRDYTFIKQAVNYYLYNAAVAGTNPDLDGPSYSNSCAGESESKLFVSVPQGGESDPAPAPNGWAYNRVGSASLTSIRGTGWLPIDFGTVSPPLASLPVDPVNTFASGYFYTYTCGSFELNLRFESEKYQALASTDGGDDDSVFEAGSVLSTAPYQSTYHPASAPTSGTLTLRPNANGFYSAWSGSYADVDDTAANDSDRVFASTTSAAVTFALEDPSQSGTITAVRLVVRANRVGLNPFQIRPRLRSTSAMLNYDSAPITLTTSYANYTTSYATNPLTGLAWTWSDVNDLQAGVLLSTGATSGSAQVSEMYVEVDYQ
jgi:prepilin-type N-terminal cleavage/methylation domain-containing protein